MKLHTQELLENQLVAEILPVIDGFWSEMCAWERNCMTLQSEFKQGKLSHEQLKSSIIPLAKAIFDKYCICGKNGPKRIANNTYVFGSPPDYDPDIDTIISVAKIRTAIEVVVESGSRVDCKFVYSIKIRDGVLRLVDKRILMDEDDPVTSGL